MDNSTNLTLGSKTGSNQVEIDFSSLLPLQHVAQVIAEIITRHKMLSQVKLLLEGIIKYTKEEEDKERKLKATWDASLVASVIHKVIEDNITKMHSSLAKQLNNIQETANATLTGMDII